MSATQNIYNDLWRYSLGNETGALYALDILCYPGCGGKTGRYLADAVCQHVQLGVHWRSNYNGGQLVLRHAMRHGFQMEFSYTYSKSMDMGSDDERTVYSSSTGSSVGSSFSAILNAWNPRPELCAVRLRHSPPDHGKLGRGPTVRQGQADRQPVESLAGSRYWRLAALRRGPLDQRASVQRDQRSRLGNQLAGEEQHDPDRRDSDRHLRSGRMARRMFSPILRQALANLQNPYPGEAGQRNNFRGDGYFGIDARLAKTWKLSERTGMQFAWDVFNVTNSVRFDVNPLNSLQNLTTSGSFGVYGATLTTPRVQQLSLRFSF